MPNVDSYTHGTPSWIDLSTTDPAAAQAFYGELFGWSFEANPTDAGGEYIMASRNGRSAAGMMQQAPEQAEMGLPSMWNSYVSVDDVDATTARVADAGGQVMAPPFDVMDSGRMAVIVDPTGAVISLWQANQHIGAEIVNEHGALIWNELITADIDAAKPFYGDVLGWANEDMDMGDMGTYTLFKPSADADAFCGGMAPPMPEVPNHWSVYFAVDDADETVARIGELGGQVLNGPVDSPPGRLVVATDPTGAVFQVMQPAEMG